MSWAALEYSVWIYNTNLCVLWDYQNTTLQVTSKKKSIKYNLPIQIGFFVYQYAKLRMLAFFYDVIDEFISREDYCLLEMDTGNFRQIMCICNFNVILYFESDL